VSTGQISFRKINWDNLDEVLELKPSESQAGFMASIDRCLAQAYASVIDEDESVTYAIYHNEVPVGFCQYYYEDDFTDDYQPGYYLWRILIDQRYQGKGLAKAAVSKLLAEIRQKPFGDAEHLYLGCSPSNTTAIKLFEFFGFEPTGEIADGEAIYKLAI